MSFDSVEEAISNGKWKHGIVWKKQNLELGGKGESNIFIIELGENSEIIVMQCLL